MSAEQVLDICNVSLRVQFCKCVAVSGGVDRISPCSHSLRQPLVDMKVTGTWQVNSSARGKSHLRLGLCMSAGMFFTVSPPYGDTQGGVLRRRFPPRSLGVLGTMMRQMIGIKVVDCSCFSFSQRFQAVKKLITGTYVVLRD
jgi:hypothetical protein